MNCSQCKWGVFKSPEDDYGDCMHPKQEYSAIKQHGRVPDWCKGKFEKGQRSENETPNIPRAEGRVSQRVPHHCA
jgi:hypothetical protein